ncbi:hypothetical protein V8E36_000030 [Tilletia maclaganii]
MKHIHTFLLVAVGLVGLAVSGPVTMEGTAQSQQHNLERAQILDKRPLSEPSDFGLCMASCKSSHTHTDSACQAWCNKCLAQGHGNCY